MNISLSHGMTRPWTRIGSLRAGARQGGFTLVELMTVVGLMGMLITLALPNFIKARSNSQERICITNLNKIEWAKQMWGLENTKSLDDIPVTTDISGVSGYLKEMPECPSQGEYDLKALKEPATCSVAGHTL
jgi:prepilin-type N-terminal cleavage/methylation domain-containing protein